MGFYLEFDAGNNAVRLTFEGTVTRADIGGGAYSALQSFVQTRPPCKGIADFSRVTQVEASSLAIRQRAKLGPAMPGGQMFVLVAPQDHMYGLSRMFSMVAEETRPNLRVARTMDEAYNLLGISSPQFTRVSD
jgi:hypothetical protein